MKTNRAARTSAVFLCLLLAAGCMTGNKRISSNQKAFNSYPPHVRQQIINGEVAIGFTEEQVRMSIGSPSRVSESTTQAGTAVVWEYRSISPPGLGAVVGASTRRGPEAAIYSGVHTHRTDLNTRIFFDRRNGTVSKIETFK